MMKKKEVKFAKPINMPMSFLKFNNILKKNHFFRIYIIKIKIDDHIIKFNYKKKRKKVPH
jgi:hypothetical protein